MTGEEYVSVYFTEHKDTKVHSLFSLRLIEILHYLYVASRREIRLHSEPTVIGHESGKDKKTK